MMFIKEDICELKRLLGVVEAAEKNVLAIREAIRNAKVQLAENKATQANRAQNKADVLLGYAEAKDYPKPELSQHDLHTLICDFKKKHEEAQQRVSVVRGNYRAKTCDAIQKVFDQQMENYALHADALAEAHTSLISLAAMLPGKQLDDVFRNALEIPGTTARGPAYVPKSEHRNYRAYLHLTKGVINTNDMPERLDAELRELVGDNGMNPRDKSYEFMVMV